MATTAEIFLTPGVDICRTKARLERGLHTTPLTASPRNRYKRYEGGHGNGYKRYEGEGTRGMVICFARSTVGHTKDGLSSSLASRPGAVAAKVDQLVKPVSFGSFL